MALAAVLFLSERMTVWRAAGLALGFSGVIVLVWPDIRGGAHISRLIGYANGLVAAVLSALALIMVPSLSRSESPGAIAVYFVLASIVGALFTIPWGWIMPTGNTLLLLIALGLFGGFGHIAMTLAFRYTEPSRLASVQHRWY